MCLKRNHSMGFLSPGRRRWKWLTWFVDLFSQMIISQLLVNKVEWNKAHFVYYLNSDYTSVFFSKGWQSHCMGLFYTVCSFCPECLRGKIHTTCFILHISISGFNSIRYNSCILHILRSSFPDRSTVIWYGTMCYHVIHTDLMIRHYMVHPTKCEVSLGEIQLRLVFNSNCSWCHDCLCCSFLVLDSKQTLHLQKLVSFE